MALTAALAEDGSCRFWFEGSNDAVVEQSKRVVHGAEDLTPIQAISHGPITIGGTSFSPIFINATHEFYENSIEQTLCKNPHSNPCLSFLIAWGQAMSWSRTGIPKFSNYREHLRHILIHTAAVSRDFSRKGFTEGMSVSEALSSRTIYGWIFWASTLVSWQLILNLNDTSPTVLTVWKVIYHQSASFM